MKPEQVMAYIEGDPIIGTIPVDPGLTNQEQFDDSEQKIVGLNTENADFRKDVNVMCNLGQGIEDRAIAETTAKVTKKVILNMYHSGYSLTQIADAVEMTETEVLDIITSASA